MAIIGSGTPHEDLVLMSPFPIITRSRNGDRREYKWKGPTATIDTIAPQTSDPCPDDALLSADEVRIEYFNATDSFVFATYTRSGSTVTGADDHDVGDVEEVDDEVVDTETDSEGDEYTVWRQQYTHQKWISGWNDTERTFFGDLVNKTNSGTWKGRAAGDWLCTGYKIFRTGSSKYNRIVTFMYRSAGWNTTRFPGASFTAALNRG